MSGTLFVVATPIGNLEDLSPRARQTLAEVDLIAAEDTRHTGRLLSHFGVKTRQLALHDHNEEQATQTLIKDLKDGKSVALVSDAGTPLHQRSWLQARAVGGTAKWHSRVSDRRPFVIDGGIVGSRPADRSILFRGLRTTETRLAPDRLCGSLATGVTNDGLSTSPFTGLKPRSR